MGNLRKLRKNTEKYKINSIYDKMTPEDYKNGIHIAVEEARKDLAMEFNKKYKKLVDNFNKELNLSVISAINTISVELLYELAVQMNAFDESDEERLNSIKYRVQEMYENIMNAIKKYANYKNDRQASKKFEEKRKKVEKLFDVKIY